MKNLVFALSLIAFYTPAGFAEDEVEAKINNLDCAYDGIDKNEQANDDFEVKLSFRADLEIYKSGKVKASYGSVYQQARVPDAVKDSGANVAQASHVFLKTYNPENAGFRAYLDGNGYTMPLKYFLVTGGADGDRPQVVNLYLSQKYVRHEVRRGRTEYRMKALFAVQYHDHMMPSYLQLSCKTN